MSATQIPSTEKPSRRTSLAVFCGLVGTASGFSFMAADRISSLGRRQPSVGTRAALHTTEENHQITKELEKWQSSVKELGPALAG